jgi:hypothetical protein
MELDAPWAAADLSKIRYDQSADIVYIACEGYAPYKIERRATKSWSVVPYQPENGPYNTINASNITITPSTLGTAVSLTASNPIFKSTDEGRLVRIDGGGQLENVNNIGAENTFTSAIRITGVGNDRIFTVTVGDRTDSTITLQRSLGSDSGPWTDAKSYTTNVTETYDDTLDNTVAWYRIGIKTGDYGTDAVDLQLEYSGGSTTAVWVIENYSSSTVVIGHTLKRPATTDASVNWYLGSWSATTGYPTTVSFTEGRLGWFGRNKSWLSVSDGYEDFDDETEGDSGPITRTIGSGSVDRINWALSLRRLVFGTDTRELTLKSSSDDEPLTPSNASIRDIGTQGSAQVIGMKLDRSGLFVQRSGIRLMEVVFNGDSWEHGVTDLTVFNPEIGNPEITHIALQRQPDTRVHCVRSDGTVAVLLHDPAENVSCWIELTVPGTDAAVEDIVVLPGADGTGEDAVYYSVKRTVNGSTVRFLEKWSLESECQGGTLSKQVDAHLTGTVSGGLMTGLSHLEGETVAVWVNGADAGTYTVSGGDITGVTADGSAVAGLPYTAQWKSAKLGDLLTKKNLMRLGVILYNTHYQGLQYGPDFSSLDNLPMVKDGTTTADDTIHGYDEETFSFDGLWDSDSRLCLQAASPRPCTLLAALIELET